MSVIKIYWLVENPDKKTRVILADSKFHAIAKAVHLDNHKWSNALYKAKKSVL